MKAVSIGSMGERIAIERLVMVDDERGGQVEDWQPAGTVWAEVRPTGGRESIEAGALQGVQGWRVTIRHRADLAGQSLFLRFLWRGRTMNVKSIEDADGSGRYLVAFAESGVAT